MGIAPDQPSGKPLCIRINQELVGVEAKAALRLVRAVHPGTIDTAGHDVTEVAVPDVLRPLRQRDPLDPAPALPVERAGLYFLRVGRRQRNTGSLSRPTGP